MELPLLFCFIRQSQSQFCIQHQSCAFYHQVPAFSNRDNSSRFYFLLLLAVVLAYASMHLGQCFQLKPLSHPQLINTIFPARHPTAFLPFYLQILGIIALCPTDFSNQWLEHLSYRRALGFELRENFGRLAGKDSNIRPLTRSCGVILTWHCYRYLTSSEVSALRLVLRITLSYICFKS